MTFKKLMLLISFVLLSYVPKTRSVAFEYPIPELGNCRDQKECRIFCEIPAHRAACWSYKTFNKDSNTLGEETPETKLSSLGITFPIPELGNCASIRQCKGYCNLAGTAGKCQDFALRHGLLNQESIIHKASEELGCGSQDECRSFCNDDDHQVKCSGFADKYNLVKAEPKIISQAQIELGCMSILECFTYCELSQNKSKCVSFALEKNIDVSGVQQNLSKIYLEELVQRVAQKLGCSTLSTCREFCEREENQQVCKEAGQTVRQKVAQIIIKKGNCDTFSECQQMCKVDPAKCPNFPTPLTFPTTPLDIIRQFINRPRPSPAETRPDVLPTPSPVEPLFPPVAPAPVRVRPSPRNSPSPLPTSQPSQEIL